MDFKLPRTLLIIHLLLDESLSVDIFDSPQEFCYSEPECGPGSYHWKPICHNGHYQSPVDIRVPLNMSHLWTAGDFINNKKLAVKFVRLPKFEFQADHYFLQNNGHTVNIDFTSYYTDPSTIGGLFPGYGFTNVKYRFAHAHLHWGMNDSYGSEHLINGKGYSMELHLVHYNTNYRSVKHAVLSGEEDALAVVAIFLQAYPDVPQHPALETLVDNLLYVNERHWYWAKIEEALNIGLLFPHDSRVFSYKGSLTTPECYEQVSWFIFEQPIAISSEDVKPFRKIVDGRGKYIVENNRPTQRHYARQIKVMYLV